MKQVKKKIVTENDIKNIMGRAWEVSPSQIPDDIQFNQFSQWDSFGHVTLLVALETEYGITINYDTLTTLTNLTAIINHLNKEFELARYYSD